jgi:hypothetical protein
MEHTQHNPALLSRRTFCKGVGIAAAGLALPLGGCVKEPKPPKVFSVEELAARRAEIAPYQELLQVTNNCVLGLNSDGTVRAVVGSDSKCDVSGWEDVVSIRITNRHAFGLKRDGTVYMSGFKGNEDAFSVVLQWDDVLKIELDYYNIFGVTSAGTVLMAGNNLNNQADISDWVDIIAVSSEENHTLGLKADGTVLAVGSNADGQCDVEGWTDVAAIYTSDSSSFGLTSGGRVLVAGYCLDKERIETWVDIVEFYPMWNRPAGLKADGTIVQLPSVYFTGSFPGASSSASSEADGTVGFAETDETLDWRNVIAVSLANGSDHIYFGIDADRNLLWSGGFPSSIVMESLSTLLTWSDIVAISSDSPYVALKSDGTVLSLCRGVYSNSSATFNYDFSDWKLF